MPALKACDETCQADCFKVFDPCVERAGQNDEARGACFEAFMECTGEVLAEA
jgi:hypothetical protein